MYLRRSRPESMHPHKAPQRPLQQNTISVHSNMSASSSPVVRSATGESVSVMEPYTPPAQSVILLMKRLYWDRIIAGEKTLEIRCKLYKPKRYFVGGRGEIWGTIVLGQGQVIETDDEWHTLAGSKTRICDVYRRPYLARICGFAAFTVYRPRHV